MGGYEGTIQEGTEDGPGQIEVTVPAGMSLENVTPVLTFSEGANPESTETSDHTGGRYKTDLCRAGGGWQDHGKL